MDSAYVAQLTQLTRHPGSFIPCSPRKKCKKNSDTLNGLTYGTTSYQRSKYCTTTLLVVSLLFPLNFSNPPPPPRPYPPRPPSSLPPMGEMLCSVLVVCCAYYYYNFFSPPTNNDPLIIGNFWHLVGTMALRLRPITKATGWAFISMPNVLDLCVRSYMKLMLICCIHKNLCLVPKSTNAQSVVISQF